MGKNIMGFFYGKLYNSCNRTFSVGNGEKFIGGTGQRSEILSLSRCSRICTELVLGHFFKIFNEGINE